jgi:hypothetical protein
MRELLVDKVRSKAWPETLDLRSANPWLPFILSIASRHIKQPIVFQIQEDLEDAS